MWLLRVNSIVPGGVGEWLTPAVLKTVRPERVSWVRIPPPPPASLDISLYSFQLGRNRYFTAQLARIDESDSFCLYACSANRLNWLRYSPRRIRQFPFAKRKGLPKNLIL